MIFFCPGIGEDKGGIGCTEEGCFVKQWKPVKAMEWMGLWCLGALAAAAAAAGLTAWLILKEAIPEAQGPLLAQLLASAMLFGAIYMSVKAAPDHRLLYALAMGCVYLGLGLLLRAAVGAGSGVALHGSAVLPLIAAVAAGLLSNRRPFRRRR